MTAPIRITRAGRLGRAEFRAFGSTVTILVAEPGSVARAAISARRGLTVRDLTGGAGRAGAADRLAVAAAAAAGCGLLVSIDGDIATAGPAPADRWRIRIAPGGSAAPDVMYLAAGGLATVRSTGEGSPWRSVTVAGGSCREARIVALDAVARGEAAAEWVTSLHLDARLARTDGSVVHTGRWSPEPAAA